MKYLVLVFLALVLVGCTSMEPALSFSDSPTLEAYPVKGRQGLLINQKLRFGEYETSKVKRSWTRIRDTRTDLSGRRISSTYPDLISKNYSDKDQSYYFQIIDSYGNFSDVYATSEFHSRDLQLGDNPNSVGNILQDIFGGDYSENIFYLQLFVNEEERPWQLFLDNDAAKLYAKDYEGILALDRDHYYILQPITKIKGKNKPEEIFGSVGYEILNKEGKSVAAVSLVDAGRVYFHTRDPKERFLMANLSAALLLQEDLWTH